MADAVTAGRAAYDARAWLQAFEAYSAADEPGTDLGADDLQRFATSAAMLDRYDDYFAIREHEYRARMQGGDVTGAVRTAVWIGVQKLVGGQEGAGSGWLARASRLCEGLGDDCAERGWLLMAQAVQTRRDIDGATNRSDEADRLAHRFGDADLAALTLHGKGLALLAADRVESGLAALDEAMVVLAAGAASPMVVGIVYCGVISGCWDVYELRRAQEWTAAMTAWCAAQPEMANFSKECAVRRAELKQLHGDWRDALSDLAGFPVHTGSQAHVGAAAYVRGNLCRLLGRWEEAEDAFREAGRLGVDPQPGLAQLRLARGSTQAAAAMMRRVLAEPARPGRRVELLVAACDVFLAVDDDAAAAAAAGELERIAERQASPVTAALAAQARAGVECRAGQPAAAAGRLRDALGTWRRLPAPYQEARVRELLAQAYEAAGDGESARRELADARAVYERLGAIADLRRLGGGPRTDGGLTPREREVLGLLATGLTNRAIADRLVLSERTVDRHVSNILAKLGVPTRAAAVAKAAEHDLA